MRKAIKKLTLNRETIGGLEQNGIEKAAGGAPSFNFTACCPTVRNCGSALSQCVTVCIPCQTATNCIATYTC